MCPTQGRGIIEQLEARHGIPFKVGLRKFEQLVDRGLLNFGSSIRFPWLTDAGKQRLRELEDEATKRFHALLTEDVLPCPSGRFHLLPPEQVKAAARAGAGGAASCEGCGALIYVPPAPRYKRSFWRQVTAGDE